MELGQPKRRTIGVVHPQFGFAIRRQGKAGNCLRMARPNCGYKEDQGNRDAESKLEVSETTVPRPLRSGPVLKSPRPYQSEGKRLLNLPSVELTEAD